MNQRTLFVILGAGASFDSSSRYSAPDTRPPLVSGLFDTRFDGFLNHYPMAKNAAPDVRDATSSAVSLEEHLRTQYRDSADAPVVLAHAVPAARPVVGEPLADPPL